MRGDPDILTREFLVDFDLHRAMDAADYRGQNRIYEAARDLKERARVLCPLPFCDPTKTQTDRILSEYERIAFADDADIRISDKLRALEMYRALADPDGSRSAGIVINYDYGDEG